MIVDSRDNRGEHTWTAHGHHAIFVRGREDYMMTVRRLRFPYDLRKLSVRFALSATERNCKVIVENVYTYVVA